jgi:hypothetical protein
MLKKKYQLIGIYSRENDPFLYVVYENIPIDTVIAKFREKRDAEMFIKAKKIDKGGLAWMS